MPGDLFFSRRDGDVTTSLRGGATLVATCSITSSACTAQYYTASELDAPSLKTVQCSFQTNERPPMNLMTSGTTADCLARSGVIYPAESWYQTENTAGLITIHCTFEVYGDGYIVDSRTISL